MSRLAAVPMVLLAWFTIAAQETANYRDAGWVRVESTAGDFSVAIVPGERFVDHEDRTLRIMVSTTDLFMSISMAKDKNAKQAFRNDVSIRDTDDFWNERVYERGDFLIRQTSDFDKKRGTESTTITFASSKGYYTAHIKSKTQADESRRFLNSIRLNKQPLFRTKDTFPEESDSRSSSSFKTDPLVFAALRVPDSKQDKLIPETSKEDNEVDDIQYSRPLIILRKRRPSYPSSVLQSFRGGTAKLLVTFLANGSIGPITLATSLDKGLDKEAFKVAKRIKFLPAELNGKAVDVTRLVEYSFGVY